MTAGARSWLENLAGLVAELCDRWDLTPGPAFPDGTEAYVTAVTRSDGTPAVLKLLVPRPGHAAHHEITVLRLTAGSGCVRLLAADEPRGALLLERLGPAMSELSLSQPTRLAILTDLATQVWRSSPPTPTTPSSAAAPTPLAGSSRTAEPSTVEPPSAAPIASPSSSTSTRRASPPRLATTPFAGSPSPVGSLSSAVPSLPSGADKAEWISANIRQKWDELGRPCTQAAVDQALIAAESRRRAHNPARAVLNHGDVHQWNALRSGDGFKLVDPDGLWAEPEYDLGVLMREDPLELMTGDPRDRARWLAARTGTDAVAICEWGLAERVSTGLILTAVGLQPVAAQMLAAADRIASAGS